MPDIESKPTISSNQFQFVPRCIRHITSIQIRNLTPFPLRDSFTSALSKPIDIDQLTSGGQIPYVDVASPKKRLRKMSGDSITTQSSRRDRIREDGFSPHMKERNVRPRSQSSHSKINIARQPSFASDDLDFSLNTSTSKLKARPRTTSMISLVPSRLSELSKEISPISSLLLDTSQRSLEKIINSRLVETFLFVDIPAASNRAVKEVATGPRKLPPTQTRSSELGHESIKHPPSLGRQGRRLPKATRFSNVLTEDDIPDYLSSIHIPSTNPIFPIDVRSGQDFPAWIDTNGRLLTIKLWGRRHFPDNESVSYSGGPEWVVLGCWDVDLDELRELPDNSFDNSLLPSNSLVITLSPPGRAFYFTKPDSATLQSAVNGNGYASDPECRSELPVQESSSPSVFTSQHRTLGKDGVEGSQDYAASASWQDIFKLVSTQSCVVDTNKSLLGVVDEIGTLLHNDGKISLRRDISLRESRIQEIKLNVFEVLEKSSKLKVQLQARAARLRRHRAILELAKEQVSAAQDSSSRTALSISKQRQDLLLLRSNLAPLRVSLITILSNIFPIELSSPPDLLYTILNAPLPIPTGPTDPAPPTSLPEHKNVTEDTVATALGYVAQVLQLISIYMGRHLTYPVTYVGSRSLIRDDISAMVGPRMFPLFSVGVDTYRFEYGVFLLNKNIEMLMMERELRALDMRHTLPNLKNLLLTLSHGQGAPLRTSRIPDSPVHDPRDIRSDSFSEDGPVLVQTANERSTPRDDSGTVASTTTGASGSGKLRLLSLGPFAEFIRSHQLSARTFTNTPKSNGDISGNIMPQEGDGENSSLDIDEDQKTIHASPSEEATDNVDRIMQITSIQPVNAETT